ncbi:TRAPP trafficking subunit Trs65-domain-containing protein [Podospora aff. communis PSN243]|uniref:TRAPP trafficking subunit Trs65-domain-containing protein n=1 Tax=Podospora aff. communis PSN243 TaxID=3040156 RepID=A0AAV9GVN8_9PEZI|nr:TRAPP trafficking subunit Trs65-domain-containing protein [Podospora aff. communis PSN243]
MAVPSKDETSDSDRSFLENSSLTYIIPAATQFAPEETLQQGKTPFQDQLSAIEQREQLFFDEAVDIYLVLRALCADTQVFRTYLRRLVVSIEAQIVNPHAPEREGPPTSEIIFSGTVEEIPDPFVATDESAEEEEPWTYAVWKLPVFLARPRIRLQGPHVVISAEAGLRSFDPRQAYRLDDGYMQSCTPSGMNLLEAFANDPMLGGVKPELSALRVSRVAPATQLRDAVRRIKSLRNFRLPIYPVVHTRVRFARPNTSPPSPALIALLEVDFTPFFDCEAFLEKVTLNVTDSTVDDLNIEEGMKLPLSCVAHDHLTFIYKLAPQHLDVVSKSPNRDLVINIEVKVLVNPEGPRPCTPRLAMSWTTNIDYTLPVNPGFGQPIPQPIQRAHRPSQLSIGGNVDVQSLISPSVSRPDALPSLEAATARPIENALPDFGITMTFTGPDQPVYAGEEFAWSVFVVNRSKQDPSNAAAPAPPSRKLALIAIPKRRRNELRVIRPPSTSGHGAKRDPTIADAVLDENVVHAMQRNSVVDNTEVVCLSADVRIGPLAPSACAVVELRFLALQEGIVSLEAVRVVDLGSSEHVDIRELPTVVVKSRDELSA